MKTWQKLLVAVVCGGAIYGLGFAATVWTNMAQPCILAASAIGALCTVLTGFKPTT